MGSSERGQQQHGKIRIDGAASPTRAPPMCAAKKVSVRPAGAAGSCMNERIAVRVYECRTAADSFVCAQNPPLSARPGVT